MPAAPIQIQILCGPQAGRRLTVPAGPITCGRDMASVILLDGPHVSRQHFQIVEQELGWAVVNLSPNGLRVNGKKVAEKPWPLNDNDTISVGDDQLVRVSVSPMDTTTTVLPEVNDPSKAKPKKRGARLWLGIAAYMIGVLLLFVYISKINEVTKKVIVAPPELSTQAISDDIRRPRPMLNPSDPRAAQAYLQEAQQHIARPLATPDSMFQAYDAYRRSLAASGKDTFDSATDQINFQDIQNKLTDRVTQAYKDAYLTLRSNNFKEAARRFGLLLEMYPLETSAVYRSASQQRQYATQRLGKSKF